jgi:hypothetical protein
MDCPSAEYHSASHYSLLLALYIAANRVTDVRFASKADTTIAMSALPPKADIHAAIGMSALGHFRTKCIAAK